MRFHPLGADIVFLLSANYDENVPEVSVCGQKTGFHAVKTRFLPVQFRLKANKIGRQRGLEDHFVAGIGVGETQ